MLIAEVSNLFMYPLWNKSFDYLEKNLISFWLILWWKHSRLMVIVFGYICPSMRNIVVSFKIVASSHLFLRNRYAAMLEPNLLKLSSQESLRNCFWLYLTCFAYVNKLWTMNKSPAVDIVESFYSLICRNRFIRKLHLSSKKVLILNVMVGKMFLKCQSAIVVTMMLEHLFRTNINILVLEIIQSFKFRWFTGQLIEKWDQHLSLPEVCSYGVCIQIPNQQSCCVNSGVLFWFMFTTPFK